MSFRDDQEAKRTRIEELERELARVTERSEKVEAERDAQREKLARVEGELAVLKEDPKVAARMKENARRTKEREEKERREREQAESKKRDSDREAEAAKRRASGAFSRWLKVLGAVLGVGVLGFGGYSMCAPPTWTASHAPPSLGMVDLSTTPSPSPVQGTATGERPTPPGCIGSIPAAPQLVVRTQAASLVSFNVAGQGDTVLVVLGSDGTSYCDDDSAGATNPAISTVLPPGEHRVWVGTYHDDATPIPFAITIASSTAPNGPVDARGLAPTADPTHGEQRPTEMPMPFAGTVLPSVSASDVDGRCVGHIAVGPSLVVAVDTPTFVRLDAAGNDDLVLLVEGPGGSIRCDDDGGPSNTPLIAELFEPGRYRVWVGTYASRTTPAPYSLVLRGTPQGSVAEPPPQPLTIGGEIVLAADTAAARDARCNVLVSASPSAVIDLASALDVTVRSAQPGTVLRIEGPDGVRCLPSGVSTWMPGRHRVNVAVDAESGGGASAVTLTAGAASLVPYAP